MEKVRLEIKKDIDRLKGKYKAKLLQMVELRDEIYISGPVIRCQFATHRAQLGDHVICPIFTF